MLGGSRGRLADCSTTQPITTWGRCGGQPAYPDSAIGVSLLPSSPPRPPPPSPSHVLPHAGTPTDLVSLMGDLKANNSCCKVTQGSETAFTAPSMHASSTMQVSCATAVAKGTVIVVKKTAESIYNSQPLQQHKCVAQY